MNLFTSYNIFSHINFIIITPWNVYLQLETTRENYQGEGETDCG